MSIRPLSDTAEPTSTERKLIKSPPNKKYIKDTIKKIKVTILFLTKKGININNKTQKAKRVNQLAKPK